jgi:predicted metalloendopeptidase
MNNRCLLFPLLSLTACAGVAATNSPSPAPPAASGLDRAGFDDKIRPQDDLYRHVNGRWLDVTPIPPDKSNYSMFAKLEDDAREQIHALIEELAKTPQPPGTNQQKIADFFRSFMDEARANQLGLAPLQPQLDQIRKLGSKREVAREIGRQQRVGLRPLLISAVDQDAKEATAYILQLAQGGLGLPDRDYYLSDDPKMEANRKAYRAYVQSMLALAGHKDAPALAEKIFDLELDLARGHWTRAETRDRDKTYNKVPTADLAKLAPALDWAALFEGLRAPASAAVIVREPSYFKVASTALEKAPLPTWRAYLEWRLLDGYAPLLSQPFVDAHFAFHGTTLSGIESNEERWKRALEALDGAMGQAVGELYVARHFRPEAKARMQQLVNNIRQAFGGGIDGLPWMSDATKQQARAKLAKFVTKIGYPDHWRDYARLTIQRGDLVGNIVRATEFESDRNLAKLGHPVDRSEWFMTPQTVNAYYNASLNEIVFPAAILQPPFFDPAADDAVNYGAIGAVIGHELSHGFDDQGRKSDGDGNLRDWWTQDDASRFKEKATRLVSQYHSFEPLPGQKVNGELTLGENIGDLGGLTIAYRAYRLSLAGREPPQIDGTSGPQRFFMGWAQVWRRKYREPELRRRLVTDPHSPAEYRVLGVVANMPEYHEAFGVKAGDKAFRPEEERVKIW